MNELNGALSELARGIENEVRDTDPEMHVAFFDPGGGGAAPDGKRVFTDESTLNEWTRALPERDTAVVVRYEEEPAGA